VKVGESSNIRKPDSLQASERKQSARIQHRIGRLSAV
jgi:hypothetical protein